MKRLHKKFSKLGFDCLSENKYGVVYGRDNESGSFRHIIAIMHQHGGVCFIHSYREDINSDGRHNVVGMTPKELTLAGKACRRMARKYKWHKW